MKILIGTPIHEVKDYSMRRWLRSVSEVKTDVEWRLLMVDNSENPGWYKRVHGYCQELGFYNYDLVHLPDMKDGDTFEPERLGFSRELIREELLRGYDYWWSWECDILCPPGVLDYLLRFATEFDAVYHTYPPRGVYADVVEQDGIGCVLYHRRIFENWRFVENKMPLGADGRLLFETIRRGFKQIDIHNIFKLVHLAS